MMPAPKANLRFTMGAPAVGYIRVSTARQGRSGLGLRAQQDAIAGFAEREGFEVIEWRTEIETGRGSDALDRRPQLAEALRAARKSRCPVLVAKLDRLSRDVHFISGLMAERVEFVVTELGRQTDPFVLHLYAALAEKERSLISQRTRDSLRRARSDGKRLGMRNKSKAEARRIQQAGADAVAKEAMEWAKANRWAIEGALKEAGSLLGAARLLNERNVSTPSGGRWHASSVKNVAGRLGLLK